MSILTTSIVAGVSILFMAVAIAPMAIDLVSRPSTWPDLVVVARTHEGKPSDHQPQAA